MNDWLEVMLDEIARKERELAEAREELERRRDDDRRQPAGRPATEPPAQSK